MDKQILQVDTDTLVLLQDQRGYNTYVYLNIVQLEKWSEGMNEPPRQIDISLNQEQRYALIRLLGGTPNEVYEKVRDKVSRLEFPDTTGK